MANLPQLHIFMWLLSRVAQWIVVFFDITITEDMLGQLWRHCYSLKKNTLAVLPAEVPGIAFNFWGVRGEMDAIITKWHLITPNLKGHRKYSMLCTQLQLARIVAKTFCMFKFFVINLRLNGAAYFCFLLFFCVTSIVNQQFFKTCCTYNSIRVFFFENN